ncbi:MAG: type I DNA topoisomerase [Acidimicrobiia bacterium]
MPSKLVVVESPAKARTIAGYLGPEFVVESSIGHVRDLPRNAADVPGEYKGEAWARLGVDVDNDFKPLYIVPKEKKRQIAKLKRLLKEATELYLATDEDREGESIAWHLTEVLNPRVPVKRMVFHEITPDAIELALDQPRELDRRLVDAQEARRILDRLFGYEVSPVLWRMVRPKLSAGRVQSPATRIVVERERARMRFRSARYWGLQGTFHTDHEEEATFGAGLASLDGRRLAAGKDFGEDGRIARKEVIVLDESEARALVGELEGAEFSVRSVERKPYRRSPYPPFMTSTLQQEAGRQLRFSAQRTMGVAQWLYENGYITYMRTDSTLLSETALAVVRNQVRELYGSDYLHPEPRRYRKKVRSAQEAHEAIRPAGDGFRTPDQVSGEVGRDEARLYELIWKRTVASQMADARGESVQARLGAVGSSGRDAEFAASGKVITFPGFMRAYVEGSDDPDAELEDQERRLPSLHEGDVLGVISLEAIGRETKPPARFTEAGLVRRLEELGIGRPSTYASIIGTIQDRGYVWKKGSALVPSFTAFATVTLLERHFPDLVDYEFTARMEDELDKIAGGDQEAIPWLSRFYFGNGRVGLKEAVSEQLGEIDAREVNSVVIGEDADGVEVVARVGKYGPFVQRGEETAGIPDDLPPDELTVERALEMLSAPSQDRMLGEDPETGLSVIARNGRYGPYVQLGEVEPDGDKPKTVSLLGDLSLDTITLDEALRLLSLPRVVGSDPETGQEVVALHGRYGPYVKRGKETRSLETEERLFTVTLEEAQTLFAQPKRRRRRAAAPPLRELGPDPETERPIVVRKGRFGPYVTDGEVNASLRQGDAVEGVTVERAAELLALRRRKLAGKQEKSGSSGKRRSSRRSG